jgi:hypothetical protein
MLLEGKAMTAYTWIGGTGNWKTASNWRPAGPPTATDTATISETGAAYTVTINSADVAQSLTENSSSATVDDTGTLTLGGTFTLSAGTFILGQGGTLSGGTTELTGGTFTCDGGTMIGVTYDGALDLSEANASVGLAGGTVVNNAKGTGAGTINDTGSNSTLYLDNTQTFNNATINLGGTSKSVSTLEAYDPKGVGTVLTLGSNVTVDESGDAIITDSGDAGDGIVNQGDIKQSGTKSTLDFNGNSLTNSGTITAASSGGALTIDPTTFANSGTLAISNGDAVTIEASNFSNTGSITLASGVSLYLDTTVTLAKLGTVSNSGTVYIDGTLNLAGGTLNGSTGLGQPVLDGGTVEDGTVTPAGLAFSTSGGTLSGVTYDGALNLTGEFVSLHLASGTVVNNAKGTGAGTINDTGYDSTLYFDNTQTFNNATINLGYTPGYYGYLEDYDSTGAGTVLTLGSNVTIDESGYGYIADSGYAGDGIVNKGAINQSGTGSYLTFNGNSFTNSGTITAGSSGGTLTIAPTTFANSGTLAVTNGDAVTIEATNFSNTGSITLASASSLYLDIAFTLAELGKFTDSGGTVYIEGTFNLAGGTLNASSGLGQAALDGGTVEGGTVTPAGLVFSSSGGTLSGVTYDGTLNLSGSGATVSLADGTVTNNAAGTGAGTINDTGYGSILYFDNTQTFNNATINLGSTSEDYIYNSFLEEYDQSGTGTVLTLGSNVSIDESGYAQIADSGDAGDGIVNQGAIEQSGTGSDLVINGNSFTNSGTITAASSGGALTIDPTTFTNSGTLAVSNGDAVTIEAAHFSNTGSITLASASSLYMDATFTLAELGTLTNSDGTVYIDGTLNLAGGTLNASSGLGQAVLDGGAVDGGTVASSALGLSSYGGTLSGVTYDGALNLLATGASISLADGTVVNNAAGTGAGTINDTGEGAALYFDNTQTFNNATINLGSSTSGDYSTLDEYDQTGAGTVLTLGSNVAVNESGYAQITDSGDAGDGIVNQGAIKQSGTSSQLTFSGNSLTNSGTITGASSGGALTIEDTTFTNYGAINISSSDNVTIEPTNFTNAAAGVISVGADATLTLTPGGSGSNLGSITLASGSSLVLGSGLTDNGLIQLGGGTLTATATGSSLTIGTAGELIGFGVVDATTLTDSGEIEASGGTLTVQNAIAGAGGVQIDANATLVLDASTASDAPVTFAGASATLTLENPANFAGAVGGLGLDDTFDLVGVTANGASVNGSNQLVVTDNGTTVATVQLSGSNSGFAFVTQAVSGGTDVIALPDPATVAQYLAYPSLYDLISGGFAISDTAANISANLDALNDANINTITISDNGVVGATVAQLSSDSTAIGKLANANETPYQLAIADSLPNIVGDLSSLNSDSNVVSLTATSGSATLSGGVGVSAPSFSETGSGTSLTIGEVFDYAGAFTQGAGSTTAITSGNSLTLTGTASLSGTTSGAGTLDLAGGSATIDSGATLSVSNWSVSGSGTVVTLGEALTYSGSFSEGAGSSISISNADELSLTGTSSLSGTTSGAGTLDLAGGSATIETGAALSVSNWSISGSGTDVTLGEALTYSGSFSEGADDTFVLSGGNLVLTGADTFAGGAVDGAKLLVTEGTTAVSGLTIGGTAEWENTSTATESDGTVTIGDSSGDEAFLDNTAAATYDIVDNSGIARGSSTASYIKNVGLFEKTGGTGTSTIAPGITNTGTLEVTSGTLDFKRAVTGTGTDTISGASTLEFAAAVGTIRTLGDQNIGFTGGGTLDLTDPTGFWGEISGFAATDTIELLGSWAFSKFSENSGGTLATLTLVSGATKHAFDFVGDYTKGDFQISSGATSTITFT